MYSDTDLERAVAAGAITPEAAGALRRYLADQGTTPVVDEEQFRLLSGFNDIFVAIASVLLLVALAWIGDTVGPKLGGDGPSLTSGLFVAAAAWGLAEFFTLKRRMALPSIILLLAFTGGVFIVALVAIGLPIGDAAFQGNNDRTGALLAAAAAAIAAGATWLHWRRFRVPITIAAGAAAVAGIVMALIAFAVGDTPVLRDAMLTGAFLLGLGVFGFAMWWDASDRERKTRRADVAFWLHLLAAPLIVHPVFQALGVLDNRVSMSSAVIVVLLYVLLAGLALVIDRRALMVSALAYVLFALSSLFRELGAVGLNVALTALVIGSALLLLSAYWHTVRAALVERLPDGLRAKLPPAHEVAIGQAISA
jgi:MFS family permease